MKKSPDSRYMSRHQLARIRENITDAHLLIDALALKIVRENAKEIWCMSPFRDETNPSFHIRRYDLAWHDFGSGEGGGPLELIQKIQGCDIYKAGLWALEKGLSRNQAIGTPIPSQQPKKPREVKEKRKGNKPLAPRYSLSPYLRPYHQVLRERGFSQKTCEELGCGFLPMSSKSPLCGRIIFQVRGVQGDEQGNLKPTILSHIGRALNDEQADKGGKWRTYGGFEKSLELYNIDRILLTESARQQVEEHGLLIVEGCFDVAKLHEAGIENAVATLTGRLSHAQLEKLKMISEKISIPSITIWYDNDLAGHKGTQNAMKLLSQSKIESPVHAFNWESSPDKSCKDACDFSVSKLQSLRGNSII